MRSKYLHIYIRYFVNFWFSVSMIPQNIYKNNSKLLVELSLVIVIVSIKVLFWFLRKNEKKEISCGNKKFFKSSGEIKSAAF